MSTDKKIDDMLNQAHNPPAEIFADVIIAEVFGNMAERQWSLMMLSKIIKNIRGLTDDSKIIALLDQAGPILKAEWDAVEERKDKDVDLHTRAALYTKITGRSSL